MKNNYIVPVYFLQLFLTSVNWKQQQQQQQQQKAIDCAGLQSRKN